MRSGVRLGVVWGLLVVALAGIGLVVAANGTSALPPGYVRLSQGDVVLVSGTKLMCAIQQQTRNVASPVVGIVCGLGTTAGPTPGSYWVALRAPNDVVVTRATSSNRSSVAFMRPADQPKAYSVFVRPLTLPPSKLLDVHDIGMWCAVQVGRALLVGQLAVSCWFTRDPSSNGQPGRYGFILSEKKVEGLRLGRSWQVVWSHAEPG